MSKDKNMLLHIGNPRTGTTSLQNYMAQYRAQLFQQGIEYLDWEAVQGIFRKNKLKNMLSSDFDLFTKLVRNKLDNVVVSWEFFSGINIMELPIRLCTSIDAPNLFQTHFDDYEITVFLTIRRQDTMFESSYLKYSFGKDEQIKPLSAYLSRPSNLFYSKEIQNWLDFDSIYVIPYDIYKKDNKTVLQKVFYSAFDGDVKLPGSLPHLNASKENRELLTRAKRRKILSRYEDDNRKVFRRYIPQYDYTW